MSETQNKPESSSIQNIQDSDMRRLIEIKMKRNWVEYLLEFLLVLSAVFLGFFADSVRERREDRQKEKRYIKSLLKDIEGDSYLSAVLSDTIYYQAKKIDTLVGFFASDSLNDPGIVQKCYQLAPIGLKFFPNFFYERTITQLLSSGNMRLIEDQDVADSIMAYHSDIKFLETQKELYINSVNNCRQNMYDIFDIFFHRTEYYEDGELYFVNADNSKQKFRSTNKGLLYKFITSMERAKIQADAYSKDLAQMAEKPTAYLNF